MGSLPEQPAQFDVKSIAIIGAGPSGLAAVKHLVAQKVFTRIDVYEQQPEVGGVWYYTSQPAPTPSVPQTNAFGPAESPHPSLSDGRPEFTSPMYDHLHTNIPYMLMRHREGEDFPGDARLYPSREHVEDYLVEYAHDIRSLIRFSTQVQDVRLRDSGGFDRWDIDAVELIGGTSNTETYDAVVVANGHYSTPFIPDLPNITTFHETYPEVISHSKSYRNAEPFRGQKVLIVGNSASGLDIASQIRQGCRQPLLLSVQTATPAAMLQHCGAVEVGQIEEFLVHERGVRLADGRVERDLDAIVFCTGYLYTFPFLKSVRPAVSADGKYVRGLFEHFIWVEHPTMVFPGLPMKVIPFPLAEGQAAVFARVWSNQLCLPSKGAMEEWERTEFESKAAKIHVFPSGGDGKYINKMHDWAMSAGSKGREPPFWDEEQLWRRRIFAEAKLRFEQSGRTAVSLEELGFERELQKNIES